MRIQLNSVLRRNVETFCNKQDSLMYSTATFVDRGRRTTQNLHSTVDMFATCDGPAVIDSNARY